VISELQFALVALVRHAQLVLGEHLHGLQLGGLSVELVDRTLARLPARAL